ncbi:MAG: hypothetical protein HYZ54_08915 [Ignavibacteriae bacterium]|nr:hypothetical protein [Ignavibacteriota bacterium]
MIKKYSIWLIALWIVLAGSPVKSVAMMTDDDDDWTDLKEDFLPDISFKFRQERPVIEPTYLISMVKHRELNSTSFANLGGFDLRLGYAKKEENKYSKSLIDYKMTCLFVGYNSKDFATSKPETGNIESSILRFGFGDKEGLGYEVDNDVSIVPYHATSALWTRLSVNTLPADTLDAATVNLFNDTFRFGKQAEAGILIQFTKNSGITLGYEYSVIFPRHLFWYWAGSEVIDGIVQGATDNFVRAISKSSPNAAPIVAFILKNGISYGMYELRKKNMNWPFNTAPAMTYNAFKIGVNMAF